MKDLISIIIPYYKKKKYIKRSLNSALKQTYSKFEIIVVYDDPNLEDYYFLKKLVKNKKKIKLIKNNKNLGAGYSRNQGIKYSKGKFIAFLDADDYWKKNKLSYQINFMKKNKIDFSFTTYSIINDKNQVVRKIVANRNLSFKDLIRSCDIGLSTVVLRRTILKNYKFMNIKTKEDYILWLNLSKKYKLIAIKKNLSFWQQSSNSLSSSFSQKIKDAFKVYNKFMKFNSIKSIFFVFILSVNYIIKRYL